MYSILDIAECFLNREKMTHKKLQKLCYYMYAWYFAVKEMKICYDADFQAWAHGPVSRSIWDRYKGSGRMELSPTRNVRLEGFAQVIFDCVWDVYGQYDGDELEELTHSELPWRHARRGFAPEQHSTILIEDNDMRNYYLPICRQQLKEKWEEKAS